MIALIFIVGLIGGGLIGLGHVIWTDLKYGDVKAGLIFGVGGAVLFGWAFSELLLRD